MIIIIEADEKSYTGRYDRAFKEVFLKPSNQDLLKILLEAILNVKIKEIIYEPTERNTGNLKIKRNTLDCLLKTNEGIIGIEVNSSMPPYIHPRNFAFACDMYKSYMTVGEEYSEEIKIVQINLSYGLSKKQDRIREYQVQDKSGNKFIKNFKIIEINMDLYDEKWYYLNRDKMSNEEKEKNLSLVMIGEERKNLEKLSKENRVVNKYMEELDKINKDPVFRWSISYEQDQKMIMNSEKRIAREEGHEEGIKEGQEQNKIEIAKKMLSDNINIDNISKYTGLSLKEIEELK